MNKFIKAFVLTLTVAAIALPATTGTAAARDREWREGDAYYLKRAHRNYRERHVRRDYRSDYRGSYRHRNGRDAVVGGALGLATGLIIGGAIASQPRYVERDVYVDPGYYPAPRPVYRRQVVVPTYEPWTQSWYRYCSQRYRSFNPRTGTFVGYDGLEHFCVAG